MVRTELFLWDLELFLQIQKYLKDRVVLKGGAAVQFFLPATAQRTSIDIDILFSGSKEEIESVLEEIHKNFGNDEKLFVFTPYSPKNPKTALPLYTFFVDVPTVLSGKERGDRKSDVSQDYQELKVEFIIQNEPISSIKMSGNDLFIGESPFLYNILPLNDLFADKLTTLGPNTTGVQEERKDEQIKQFYDICLLLENNLHNLDINMVRDKYWVRSKNECKARDIPFSTSDISEDVRKQLNEYAIVDFGFEEYKSLINEINNFKSLYLNRKIDFSPQSVSCGARKIQMFLIDLYDPSEKKNTLIQAMIISDRLSLTEFEGEKKGIIAKELRNRLIHQFAKYSKLPPKLLTGKNPKRIFWEIANKSNLNEIENVITETLSRRT
jgi:hypothetical protein